MEAITYTTARQKLAETMDKVIDGHTAVIITRQKAGAVVMMSLEDFNSIEETLYLLGNPANAKRLRQAVADVDAGEITEIDVDDLERI